MFHFVVKIPTWVLFKPRAATEQSSSILARIVMLIITFHTFGWSSL